VGRDVTPTSLYVTHTSVLVSTGAVSCYPTPMVPMVKIWFVHDKCLKFYSCSHKKHAKQSHLRVCGDSWTFTCLSKTVH